MNRESRKSAESREGWFSSGKPAVRRLTAQAPRWAWRRQVAAVLLLGWGYLSLLPSHALAKPSSLSTHPPLQVASLRITPEISDLPLPTHRALTGPASQEASPNSAQPASLPQLRNRLLPPLPGATAQSHVTAFGRLPLAFIENKGQVDERVRFFIRTGNQTVWLTSEGLRFDLLRVKGGTERKSDPGHPMPASLPKLQERERLVFAQDFVGATKRPTVEAHNPLPGIYNFFIGKDPAKWRTGVTGYADLIYREVWQGIDLKIYGNGGALEQEFIVRPGGDLSRIKVAYRGIDGLTVDKDGSLVIRTAFGMLKESPPKIYQEIDGKRVEVAGRFKLLGTTAYTFEVGSYHPQYALVIDPTLVYSTYLGGSGYDVGYSIAVDGSGNAYVTGGTSSSDFPTTLGAFDASHNGNTDVFVTKLNPTGSGLVYSTFLGGSNSEQGNGIAVDGSGNAYVAGGTTSPNFPTTPGAFDTSHGGNYDLFVTKLNPTGSGLAYSTFLGGSSWDWGTGIAVDTAGNAYVTGRTGSNDFPTTPWAFDATYGGYKYSEGDAFVTKLNPTGSGLVYSTFLGGENWESGSGIAVDASGNAYVTGTTYSSNFPTTSGAFDTSFNGEDAFVTKLNPTGSGLVYSTFLGGSNSEQGNGIAVDGSGNAYVTGWTISSNFPTTLGAFDTSYSDNDAFVTKLNPTGSGLVYSTFLGGSIWDGGAGIAVDASGNAYVTGWTTSPNFPTTLGAFDASHNGSWDAFATKLNPTGSTLSYSTFLGGSVVGGMGTYSIAVDVLSNAYITGLANSNDFPTTPGAYDTSYNGGGDAFVTKLVLPELAWVEAESSALDMGTPPLLKGGKR